MNVEHSALNIEFECKNKAGFLLEVGRSMLNVYFFLNSDSCLLISLFLVVLRVLRGYVL